MFKKRTHVQNLENNPVHLCAYSTDHYNIVIVCKCCNLYGCFSENSGFSTQIIQFNRVFHYKPSILQYPYFWKHPYTPQTTLLFGTMNISKTPETSAELKDLGILLAKLHFIPRKPRKAKDIMMSMEFPGSLYRW